MITDFPTAPLAPGLRGAGGSTVEKSLSASHTEILTLPLSAAPGYALRVTDSAKEDQPNTRSPFLHNLTHTTKANSVLCIPDYKSCNLLREA